MRSGIASRAAATASVPVAGEQDPVAAPFEAARERVAARLVVLDDHDGRGRAAGHAVPATSADFAASTPSATASSGRSTTKDDPTPGRLSTRTDPPII